MHVQCDRCRFTKQPSGRFIEFASVDDSCVNHHSGIVKGTNRQLTTRELVGYGIG